MGTDRADTRGQHQERIADARHASPVGKDSAVRDGSARDERTRRLPNGQAPKIVGEIKGPDGGWDYASFDAAKRRVLISRGYRVMAIDADRQTVTRLAPGDHVHANVEITVLGVAGPGNVSVADQSPPSAEHGPLQRIRRPAACTCRRRTTPSA